MTHGPSRLRWRASDEDEREVSQVLGESYVLERGPRRRQRLELLESFDRALLREGHALVRDGERAHLVAATDLRTPGLASAPVPRPRGAVFWWDLEAGPLREALKRTLGLRAAVPIAQTQLSAQEYRLRDDEGKIVVRLWHETARVSGERIYAAWTLAPLLGYEQAARDVSERLSTSSLASDELEPLAWLIMGAAGQAWWPLPIKPAVALEPDQSAQSAVTQIAQWLLRAARQNEPGIVDDVDTEFLHDYRVCLRQLRSLLKEIRGVYPEDETRRLRSELGRLATATGPLRDLDVHLLDAPGSRELLPPSLRPGLDRLFDDLRSERRAALRRLRRELRSPAYQQEMVRHESWLAQPRIPAGPHADAPIGQVVLREAERHRRKVIRLARKITPEAPAERVHALRIECKRLRYLLEMFAGLMDEEAASRLTRRLKKLQDILGRFNDCSVQQVFMRRYLDTAEGLDTVTSAAVGGLIAVLHREQQAAQRALGGRLEKLARASVGVRLGDPARPVERQPPREREA